MSVRWNPDAFNARLYVALDAGCKVAVEVVADSVRTTFGRDHGGIPSKPGTPPHTQTGRLRNSWNFARIGGLRWAAGSDLPYARYLEYGTIIMAARPYAAVSVAKAKPTAQRLFLAVARRRLRGA